MVLTLGSAATLTWARSRSPICWPTGTVLAMTRTGSRLPTRRYSAPATAAVMSISAIPSTIRAGWRRGPGSPMRNGVSGQDRCSWPRRADGVEAVATALPRLVGTAVLTGSAGVEGLELGDSERRGRAGGQLRQRPHGRRPRDVGGHAPGDGHRHGEALAWLTGGGA